MQLTTLLTSLFAATAAANTVYLIRHGEKPADGGNGLTTQGQQRAQCLRTVFGASSSYNIGYIIAEQPKDSWFPFTLLLHITSSHGTDTNIPSGGARTRPLMTVQPVATDLGLTVDTSCDRDDSDCVATLVSQYEGGKNVLICWEHDNLSNIVQSLGDMNPPSYPDAS